MKKTIALLMLAATLSTAFAQETVKPGKLIYGTVSDSNGPLAGIIVTERNHCDRIMAQTTTDVNGNFSFRLVNPNNRIQISKAGYEIIDVPINKSHYELNMKEQVPIPGVEILDGPAPVSHRLAEISTPQEDWNQELDHWLRIYGLSVVRMEMLDSPIRSLTRADRTFQLNEIPGNGIYIPFTDYTRYYTIDELFDNWYPRF